MQVMMRNLYLSSAATLSTFVMMLYYAFAQSYQGLPTLENYDNQFHLPACFIGVVVDIFFNSIAAHLMTARWQPTVYRQCRCPRRGSALVAPKENDKAPSSGQMRGEAPSNDGNMHTLVSHFADDEGGVLFTKTARSAPPSGKMF
jgi:hypothetical protein